MRWKRLLTALAGIIIVLAVTIYVVLISYDFNRLKPRITRFVKDATGRELTISGDLVLDIDFTPSISVENVTFENASWGSRAELATIKQLKVEIALLSLIRGDIRVTQLILTEPDVIIERDSSGKTNFEFRPARTRKDETARRLFAFNKVRIENGSITYRDGRLNRLYSLDLERFMASASDINSKIEVDVKGRVIQNPFEISGEIGSMAALMRPGRTCLVKLAVNLGSASLTIDGSIKDALGLKNYAGTLSAEGPSVSEILEIAGLKGPGELGPFGFSAKLTNTGGAVKVENMRFQAGTHGLVQAALSGAIDNLNTLQGTRLDFEIGGKDAANLEKLFSQPMPVHGAFSASGKIHHVSENRYDIADLTLGLGENLISGTVGLERVGSIPELSISMSSQNLDLRPHLTSGAPEFIEKGGFSHIGPLQLTMKLVKPAERIVLENIDLRFGSQKRLEARLKGAIDDVKKLGGVQLDLKVAGNDVSYLERFTGKPLPVKGTFALSGKVHDTAENTFKIDGLEVTLGETTINGNIDLDMVHERPGISAALSSKKIVLNNIQTETGSRKGRQGSRLDLGPLNLTARLDGLDETAALKTFDLKFGTDRLIALAISGSIQNLTAPLGVDLKFDIRGRNLKNLESLTGSPLPVQGSFALSGRIRDPSLDRFTIRHLKLAAAGNHLSGRVALDLKKPKPRLDITIGASKFSPHRILAPHVLTLSGKQTPPDLGPLNLKLTLAGPIRNLSLEAIDYSMGNEKRIKASLTGSVKQLATQQGVRIGFSVRGNDARTVGQLVGRPLPVQGPFLLSGNVIDTARNGYRAENLKLALGKNELQGRVNIERGSNLLRLAADLTARQLNLQPLINIENESIDRLKRVPDLGPLKLTAEVVSRAGKLSIEKLDVQTGTEQLAQLRVQGAIKDLTAPRGMDFEFSIRGNEVAKLAEIAGLDIPVRGRFGVSGRVADQAKQRYTVKNLRIVFGDNKLSGRFDADLAGRNPRVATVLESKDINLKPLTIKALAPLSELSSLGPLKIAITIAGQNDAFSVEKLDLALGNEDLAAITLRGSMKKARSMQGFNLEFSFKGKDLTRIQEFGGPAYPYNGAFHVSGKIADPALKRYQLSNLNFIWGEGDAKGSAVLDFTRQRPKVTAVLSSQKADLRPILAKAKTPNAPPNKPTGKRVKVFSSDPLTLDVLNSADADIKLKARQILLPRLALEDLTTRLLLNNGRLTVEPVKFDIGGGTTDARFSVNAQQKAPVMEAAMKIDQLEIGPMLDVLGYRRNMEGTLTTNIELSGRGGSLAEMMAGLNGDIFLMVGDGRFAGRIVAKLEQVMGGNVLTLINPYKQNPGETRLNCFTSLIRIKDGKAAGRLFLDTRQTRILGTGRIDLKTEKLNLRMKPSPKKGFGHRNVAKANVNLGKLSRMMRLGGTLAKPSLQVDKTGTAIFAGKLFGGFILAGPLGLAGVAVSKFVNFSIGNKSPCLTAIEAAKTVFRDAEKARTTETKTNDQRVGKPAVEKSESRKKKRGQ